jgi:hypothetical protein
LAACPLAHDTSSASYSFARCCSHWAHTRFQARVAGFHSGSGLAGTIAIANFVCDATRVIGFAFVTIPTSGASTMRGRVNLKSLRKNAAIRSGHFPGIWQSVGNRSVPMVHVPSYRQRLGAVASIQTLAGRNCLARARCTKEMLGTREVACMCHRAPPRCD